MLNIHKQTQIQTQTQTHMRERMKEKMREGKRREKEWRRGKRRGERRTRNSKRENRLVAGEGGSSRAPSFRCVFWHPGKSLCFACIRFDLLD